jgi:hypothetical protein
VHNNDSTNYETLRSNSACGSTLFTCICRPFDSRQGHDFFYPPKGTDQLWSKLSLLLNGQCRQSGRSVKLTIHLHPEARLRISGALTYLNSLKSLYGVHRDKFRFPLISVRQLLRRSTDISLKYAPM